LLSTLSLIDPLEMRLLLLLLLTPFIRCQCPHMGGGRVSPPSSPPPSSIQSTFLYKSKTNSPSNFALLVTKILQRIKIELRDKANLSLDNENIHCEEETSQPPCTDYQPTHNFNLFILEDSRMGARVYSLEEELNGEEETRIEAAILDALSRHSKRDLTVYASSNAEKIVGFVRELTTEELEEMGRKKEKNRKREERGGVILSPLLVHPIDNKIIEMRSAKELDTSSRRVREIWTNEEMDRLLEENAHLFILFWSHSDTTSTHAFALFSNASQLLPVYKDTVLAHVPCHIHIDFCAGLRSRDLHMIVGYSNGAKVSTMSEMEDAVLYRDWMEIVRAGPIRELTSVEEVKEVKRGFVDGKRRYAVTIANFPSREDMTFRHYEMAADKLFGQYYLFYTIKEGLPSIQTYRHGEAIFRRLGHVDEFDPLSIARFIISSSRPTIIPISTGFSTSYLLRDTRPLLLLISPLSFDTSHLSKFGHHHSSEHIVAHLDSSIPECSSVLKDLFIDSTHPHLIIFDKTKVWHMELEESNTEEEIHEWTKAIIETEPDLLLSPLSVHPLRILQISAVNRVFGRQLIDLPEDPSIYSPLPSIDSLHTLKDSQSSSGCPFMNGGAAGAGDSHHDEL
ncbi:hypothetical protein PFISCL1PPCAC_10381, partial [Pristionchus fissidentatus]